MKKSIKNFAKQSLVANQQMQLKGGCCPNGPTPYPNPTGSGSGSNGGSTSVPFSGNSPSTSSSSYSSSSGDQPGTLGGVQSNTVRGENSFTSGFATKIPPTKSYKL